MVDVSFFPHRSEIARKSTSGGKILNWISLAEVMQE